MAFKMRSPLHNGPAVIGKKLPTKNLKDEVVTSKSTIGTPKKSDDEKSTGSKTSEVDKFMSQHQGGFGSGKTQKHTYTAKEKTKMVPKILGSAVIAPPIATALTGGAIYDKVKKAMDPEAHAAETKQVKKELRQPQKKAESAQARTQLPAPGNMSALYNTKPVTFSGQTSQAGKITTGSKASQLGNVDPFRSNEEMEVDDKGTNTTTTDNVTNSNTGAEESVSGEDQTMADKLIEENEGDDSTSAERLYERNPSMYARRKARQDKRDIRQKRREERIVARNYGIEEGKKVGESYTGPSSIKEAKYETPDMQSEDENSEGAANAMTPNRAGRPINSNILMTSPVVKTGKHSARDAVAKLRMRKIAQSE